MYNNLLKNTFSQNGYIILNKRLSQYFKDSDLLIIFSYFLDKWSYFEENEFYYTIDNIMNDTYLTDRTIRKSIKTLLKMKLLIKGSFKGLPPKQFYNINTDILFKILNSANVNLKVKNDNKNNGNNNPNNSNENNENSLNSNLSKSVMDNIDKTYNPCKNASDNTCKNASDNTCKNASDNIIITNNNNNKENKLKYIYKKNLQKKNFFEEDFFENSNEFEKREIEYLRTFKMPNNFELKKDLDFSLLAMFLIACKNMRKPKTPQAFKMILNSLNKLKCDANAALSKAIESGWLSIYELNTAPPPNPYNKKWSASQPSGASEFEKIYDYTEEELEELTKMELLKAYDVDLYFGAVDAFNETMPPYDDKDEELFNKAFESFKSKVEKENYSYDKYENLVEDLVKAKIKEYLSKIQNKILKGEDFSRYE